MSAAIAADDSPSAVAFAVLPLTKEPPPATTLSAARALSIAVGVSSSGLAATIATELATISKPCKVSVQPRSFSFRQRLQTRRKTYTPTSESAAERL